MSTHSIQNSFSNTTIADVCSEITNLGSVEATNTIRAALDVLSFRRLLSLPVFSHENGEKKYFGFVDCRQIIELLLTEGDAALDKEVSSIFFCWETYF